MKVAIYSRKSIETDTGESIKNQIKLCTEYFQRNGENCEFEVFEDEGFSGGNTNRPSFQRMMELIKIKQFDVVAVYKIDRIARNIVDFVNVYDTLDKIGVKIVSITEGFDPSTPVGKMMMLLLASFAEMERMSIAQRVRDNMKELAKIGRWSGGTAPTGYTTVKVTENGKKVTYLELLKDKENEIKEMFEKFSEGYSTYYISQYLKNKGISYSPKTIQNILTNPTYLISSDESIKYLISQGYTVYGESNSRGFLPYNRRPRTNGKKTWNDKSKFVGISSHEAFIDSALWIKVHEKLKEKSIAPHPRESQYTWLAGLLKCQCGEPMFVNPGHLKKDGSRVYYFRCSSHKQGKQCAFKFLRVDFAEDTIYKTIKSFLDKNILTGYMNNDNDIKNFDKEIKVINKKIATNDIAINNLVDKLMFLSNDVSLVITKKIEELTSLNNVLKNELLKLEREQLLEKLKDTNIETLYNQINMFLKTTDIESRRYYIKTILKYIIWDSENATLQVKLLK